MKCYAGIGSRSTPEDVLNLMSLTATELGDQGWVLRSGHAPGADRAFEEGAVRTAEVYLPWPSFENSEPLEADVIVDHPSRAAYDLAAKFHPAWDKLSRGGKALMARNSHQILGAELDSRAQFVLCWTPDGKESGGTGQGLRIAAAYEVPVLNLHQPKIRERIHDFLGTRPEYLAA